MSIQLNVEVQDVQNILSGLAKLPLEISIDSWFRIKVQAEEQMRAQQAPTQQAPTQQVDAKDGAAQSV